MWPTGLGYYSLAREATCSGPRGANRKRASGRPRDRGAPGLQSRFNGHPPVFDDGVAALGVEVCDQTPGGEGTSRGEADGRRTQTTDRRHDDDDGDDDDDDADGDDDDDDDGLMTTKRVREAGKSRYPQIL